jgi:UDPglucose 6-dehydrogenase
MREAPSRVLIEALWDARAVVQSHDPQAMEEARRIYGDRDSLLLCEEKEKPLEGADALVICTEWQHLRAPDFNLLADMLKGRVIFDGRNLYEPDQVREKGLAYYAIGRGESEIKIYLFQYLK